MFFLNSECIHKSVFNFNPFLPIGWHISRICKKSFEKLQAAAYHFSKEVCENSGIVSTNRKTGFNFQSPTALGKFESFHYLAAENL